MIVRPLSTVDNTRDYARVSLRQWSNYNIVLLDSVITHLVLLFWQELGGYTFWTTLFSVQSNIVVVDLLQ